MTPHETAFTCAQQFLQTQKPLLQVIGDSNQEIATLFEKLANKTSEEHQITRIAANPQLNPIELLQLFQASWQLDIDPTARFEIQLNQIIETLNHSNQYGLIFVEKAELLSYSTLAVFSHLCLLQESKPTCLHVILGGKPLLAERLNELLQRDVPQVTLESNREDTYIPTDAQTAPAPEIAMLREAAADTTPTEAPLPEAHTQALTQTWETYWKRHGVRTLSISALALTGLLLWSHHYHLQHAAHLTQRLAHDTQTRVTPQIALASLPETSTTVAPAHQALTPAAPTTETPAHTAPQAGHTLRYTVQLASGSNKKALQKLAKRWHISKHSHIRQSQRHQHSWYALTYGHFSSKASANRAARHLKPLLKRYHQRPWVTKL